MKTKKEKRIVWFGDNATTPKTRKQAKKWADSNMPDVLRRCGFVSVVKGEIHEASGEGFWLINYETEA